jgi:asparagine synthase (glutamine-hydrolysing)
MCTAMAHRGPDNEAVWSDQQGRCWLGHRRLSIIDLSEVANQPMVSQSERYILVFNGEIYNYRALRARLESVGCQFRGTGDTEVLLEWLARYGVDGLRDLEGMFALAMWDTREHTLLLARDPLGIKPLYYARLTDGTLVFASEVRAILASKLIDPQISHIALRSYLAYGSVQGPQTLCEGIRELPSGQILWFNNERCTQEIRHYWEPKYPKQNRPSVPYQAEEFQERFDRAVESHLISDVPLGIFLSGGIDSSSLVASIAQTRHDKIHTLCVTLPSVQKRNDAHYARLVADHFGTYHTEVDFSSADVYEMMVTALAAMDRPSIDGINTFIVSKAAREAGLTVALSGLGGDELFGGYPGFRQIPAYVRRLKELGPVGRKVGQLAAASCVALTPDRRLPNRLLAFLTEKPDVVSVFADYYAHFTEREIDRLLGLPHNAENDLDLPLHARELYTACTDLAELDAISWLELKIHMGNTMLRDTDVMSMASSLEVRVPMLHTPFVDYVQALGPQVRIHQDGKFALADILVGRAPTEILRRPKEGFFLPMSDLLQGAMRPFVEEHLALADQLLFRGKARQVWASFLANPQQESWRRVWAIVVLVHWATKLGINLADARS